MNDIYHSATIRLTLWYVALVMIISVLFSGVVYHVATDEVARGLRNQTARIYQTYPVFTNNPFFLRTTDLDTSEHNILRNLLYVNLLVLVGSGFVSYWLARRTLEPIEAANTQQKRFIADASHELRTPLTALKMETEVALMDTDASNAELRSALNSNLEEANKLEVLLTNLLRLGRLESDELQHAFTSLNTDDIVNTAIERVAPQAQAKHIIVNSEGDSQSVQGDQESLVQLIVILIDNAIKYSPDTSVVTIITTSQDKQAIITVRDQGIGIAPEELTHVFDRFYRADKARTGSNGYGLGLSIAKRIADLHHATIVLRSTVGKGTSAILSVPFHEQAERSAA